MAPSITNISAQTDIHWSKPFITAANIYCKLKKKNENENNDYNLKETPFLIHSNSKKEILSIVDAVIQWKENEMTRKQKELWKSHLISWNYGDGI